MLHPFLSKSWQYSIPFILCLAYVRCKPEEMHPSAVREPAPVEHENAAGVADPDQPATSWLPNATEEAAQRDEDSTDRATTAWSESERLLIAAIEHIKQNMINNDQELNLVARMVQDPCVRKEVIHQLAQKQYYKVYNLQKVLQILQKEQKTKLVKEQKKRLFPQTKLHQAILLFILWISSPIDRYLPWPSPKINLNREGFMPRIISHTLIEAITEMTSAPSHILILLAYSYYNRKYAYVYLTILLFGKLLKVGIQDVML